MATGYWRAGSNASWDNTTAWFTTLNGPTTVTVVPGASDSAYFNATGQTAFHNVYLNAPSGRSVRYIETNGNALNGTTLLGGTSVTPATQTLTLGIGGLSLSGVLTFGSSVSLVIGGNQNWSTGTGQTLVIQGVVSGTGNVNKYGASGTATLSGNNSFTGNLTINSGIISATTNATALGATNGGALSALSTGTYSLGVAVTYSSRTLTLSGTGSISAPNNGALSIDNTGTNTFSGITLGASAYIRATLSGTLAAPITTDSATGKNLTTGAASGVTLTLPSAITGGGTLTVGNHSGDTGTVKLTASNTIGNTSIAYGTAQAGNTNAFGSTGTVTLAASTTLQTLTAGGQNGKLTVAALTNAAGGTIKIGG